MHPLAKIINQFKACYSSQYYLLLLRNQKVYLLQDGKDLSATEVLKMEIKSFIDCMVEQTLRFYDITLSKKEVKRDLFMNVLTGLVLSDEVYAIMFRLYSQILE